MRSIQTAFVRPDPQPPPCRPPSPLTHSPKHTFPAFLCYRPPLPHCYWWTHLATGAPWTHYEWTYRNMHIQGWKGGGGKGKEMHIPEVFLEHYLSSAQNNLCMSSTQSKVWNAHLHICAEKYLNAQNCLGWRNTSAVVFVIVTLCEKIPILGNHFLKRTYPNHSPSYQKDAINTHFNLISSAGCSAATTPIKISKLGTILSPLSISLYLRRAPRKLAGEYEEASRSPDQHCQHVCLCWGATLRGMNGPAMHCPLRMFEFRQRKEIQQKTSTLRKVDVEMFQNADSSFAEW